MLQSRAVYAALGAFAAALVFSFVVADATHPAAIFPQYLLAAPLTQPTPSQGGGTHRPSPLEAKVPTRLAPLLAAAGAAACLAAAGLARPQHLLLIPAWAVWTAWGDSGRPLHSRRYRARI